MSSQIDLLLGKASFSARSSGSLSSFQAYKQEELKSQSQSQHGSSYSSSAFPEFETLSLRCDNKPAAKSLTRRSQYQALSAPGCRRKEVCPLESAGIWRYAALPGCAMHRIVQE